MSIWQEQQAHELRERISACLQRRTELEGVRASPSGAAAVADQIRRLDADIAETAKSLADVERRLKDGR
jgi:hypothetical protein